MLIKECAALVKAASNETGEGQFTALVSVFGNEDSVGDVVLPGAFTQTLADWKASGNPIPVIWSHDWADPFSHIGAVIDAEETDKGLQVTGQLDMDNPKAEQVFRLLKSGRVTQFSFAYDIEEGALVDDADGIHYELRQLKLYEVGPCLVGANQETELLAVKASALASGIKEGRVLAAKHVSKLKDAHAALGEVIAAAEQAGNEAKALAGKNADPQAGADQQNDTESSAAEADAGPTPGAKHTEGRPDAADESAADSAADEPVKSAAAQEVARLVLTTLNLEGVH